MTVDTTPLSSNSNYSKMENDEKAIAATSLKSSEDKLQSLCATHAATFVAVEQRGTALIKGLNNLLEALEDAKPLVNESRQSLDLEDKDDKLQSSTLATLAEKHKLRRRTLLQHSSLLELLELPSLMDACVRGHLYDDALSIASFANTLERRHLLGSTLSTTTTTKTETKSNDSDSGQGSTVVANVIYEVRKRESDLRRHLLHRLRSEVSMPQCLEVVTALRRLNGVELERYSASNNAPGQSHHNLIDFEKIHEAMEWRLQVDFLEARDIWLEAAAGKASSANLVKGTFTKTPGSSDLILDEIDTYRTRCFEIATQFVTIFRSSSSNLVSNSFLDTTTSDHTLQLLSMWTTRRVDMFLNKHLSHRLVSQIKDTSALRDTLEASVFFATSMQRLGLDFSPLLPSIFEPCLISIITSIWSQGVTSFEETLKVCRTAGISSPLYSGSNVVSATAEHEDISNKAHTDDDDVDIQFHTSDSSKQNKTPAPPRQLLSYPPLGRLVNSFLTGLNELRRCLLPNTFPSLRRYFYNDYVEKIKIILIQNEKSVLTPGFLSSLGGGTAEASKLRKIAVEIKDEFLNCVEPYLEGALEVAFGTLATSNALDDPKDQIQDDNIVVSDTNAMTSSEACDDDNNDVTSKADVHENIQIHDM